MKSKKALVTRAAGFIGSHLTEWLLQNNYQGKSPQSWRSAVKRIPSSG